MKRTALFIALLGCSFGAMAQTAPASGERCVKGANPITNGYNNYTENGGSTGSATMADGVVLAASNSASGQGAQANGRNNIAEGQNALAEGFSASARGTNAKATGDFAQADGDQAIATGCYSIAEGTSAEATARSASAHGDHAKATADYAKADGAWSSATAKNATADGSFSSATAENASAFGAKAGAHHKNSVALGANSQTTRQNEVNVGGRQIGGVNDATLGTDAVNLRQMQAADAWTLAQAKTYADLGDQWTLNQAKHYTDEKMKGLHERIDRVGAMNTAMSMMTSSAASIPGKSKMAVGVGVTNGEPAVAMGYQRNWLTKNNRPMSFIVGAAFARKERSVGAGMAWGLK